MPLLPPGHPPWPPRRQPPPLQRALPLDPTEAEVLAEARRIWLARLRLQQQYASLEALLESPPRRHLVLSCARQALLARARAQR